MPEPTHINRKADDDKSQGSNFIAGLLREGGSHQGNGVHPLRIRQWKGRAGSVRPDYGEIGKVILGRFHHMSVKNWNSYLDELDRRFNNREIPYPIKDTVRRIFEAEKVGYSKLTV